MHSISREIYEFLPILYKLKRELLISITFVYNPI